MHKKDWVSEGVPFYRAREIVKISNNGFVDNEVFASVNSFPLGDVVQSYQIVAHKLGISI